MAQLFSLGHLRAMKYLPIIVLVGLLTGCQSKQPAASPPLRSTVPLLYQQIHVGMSRNDIYKLLGQPRGGDVEGLKDVETEIWVDRDYGEANRLAVTFGSDGRAMRVDIDTLTMK